MIHKRPANFGRRCEQPPRISHSPPLVSTPPLAVLTVNHWRDRQRGLTEMGRVAARQVVFLFEPAMINRFWPVDGGYWPEALQLPSGATPSAPSR